MTATQHQPPKGLALCEATLGIKAHKWVPVNTHGAPMPAMEGQRHSFPGAETFRNQQEVPQKIPQEIPQENPEKHPQQHVQCDLRKPDLMEQDIKNLILGDCETTDAGCHVIADIAEVKDTIEELEKIAIDEPAEMVEKAKTTTNNIVFNYHDEATHLDEVHEECVVQLP